MIALKNGYVVTPDAPPRRADVLVDGETIAAVGPDLAADEVLDATGKVVLPGLVDAHRHVWQGVLRGIGADQTLGDYLRDVLGFIAPRYSPDDVYIGTLLGAVEALDAGVTTVFDWDNATSTPAHAEAALDALDASGIRAVYGHGNPTDSADLRRIAARTGRVTAGLSILGPAYDDFDTAAAQIRLGRDLGTTVSMHLTGAGTVRRMHAAGLLGLDLNLVHLNGIGDDEAAMLADTGTGVTVTPTVEHLMGHGISAYARLRDVGARPSIGVDVLVNSPADLFEPMRDTLRTLRLSGPAAAADLLPSTTTHAARAIGLAGVGAVAAGERADLVLLAGFEHLIGSPDTAGAVIATATRSDVDTVMVDGRIVKRDGRLLVHGLADLRAKAADATRRLLGGGR